MKSFFQRIHDSHSATRRKSPSKDPKDSHKRIPATNADTERSGRVAAGTVPAQAEQIGTGSIGRRTADKRTASHTSQQPESRTAPSTRPYATLPLFGIKNRQPTSNVFPPPLPPPLQSSFFHSQRDGYDIRAQSSKDTPNHRPATKDADTVKKPSHERTRNDRLPSVLPPEVRTTSKQPYPSKPSERDAYSKNQAERNDKHEEKERQKEKDRTRQDNGRSDREISKASERDRGRRPAVEELERPREKERQTDRSKHGHKTKEREQEREREREVSERERGAWERGREREARAIARSREREREREQEREAQEREAQEREREREQERERKRSRDKDRDREREKARYRHEDRDAKDKDREKLREQPKAKHGIPDRDYAGAQISDSNFVRQKDQGSRGKEGYPGAERYQDLGKSTLQNERRVARNPSRDENKTNEGDTSDSSRHHRAPAASIHRAVPPDSRAQMDRKPRYEESPMVRSSNLAPLSSRPYSNMVLTTTENYAVNFPVSGAMHVHLPAKEPGSHSNQDRMPSHAPEIYQDGLQGRNRKEGKIKEPNQPPNGLTSTSKADLPPSSMNATSVGEPKVRTRENEYDIHPNDAKTKELPSRRSFTRQKESQGNAISDAPLPTLGPSDNFFHAHRLHAGQGPSNAYDIPKPPESTQHTARTDNQNPSLATLHSSAHLTTTHLSSDRPQPDPPLSLSKPPSIAHGDAVNRVSTTDVTTFPKTSPKDAASMALRNTLPVTSAQTSSAITANNIPAVVQTQSSQVQSRGQSDPPKPVEMAQRPTVTRTESHQYYPNSAQKSVNPVPSVSNRLQPSLIAASVSEPPLGIAHTDASFKHGSTTELPSLSKLLKDTPRDDGPSLLRNTALISNPQVLSSAGQKALLMAQNQTNQASTQVKMSSASKAAYEYSHSRTAKANVDQGVGSKGLQTLPKLTPAVVPNLIAEYEARAVVHNAASRPHVHTGPSMQPTHGSRQVSKDLPSQEFPTVVPAVLPSNSSSKSLKIQLPTIGDVSTTSLERPSAALNQKQSTYRDLLTSSMPSQKLQDDPKTLQSARVDPSALHSSMPLDKDGINNDGKYHQPYTTQAPLFLHAEKRTEEPVQSQHGWSSQTTSRPDPSMTHGIKSTSNRVLWPVEVLPSTTSQREVPSDLHTALSSRDERSGSKVSENTPGTGDGIKAWETQLDASYTGHLPSQTSVPKHVVTEAKRSPSVQGHRPVNDSRGSSEVHLPSVVRASPRQSPKTNASDSTYPPNHSTRRHRSVSSFVQPSSHPKERDQDPVDGALPVVYNVPPVSHLSTSDGKDIGSGAYQDQLPARPNDIPAASTETYRPAIHHSKLAEILSSPLPVGKKDDIRPTAQKLTDSTIKTSRSKSESAKLPTQPSSHTPGSNTPSTPHLHDPFASRQSLELASIRQVGPGSLHNSPARGQAITNTPSSGNTSRISPTTTNSTPLAHSTNTNQSHSYSLSKQPQLAQPSSTVIGTQILTVPSGLDTTSRDMPAPHITPQAPVAVTTSGNYGISQPSQKVYPTPSASHPVTSSSNRSQAKPSNYPPLKNHRTDSNGVSPNSGPSNSASDLNKPDPNPYAYNGQPPPQAASLYKLDLNPYTYNPQLSSQTTSSQFPSTRYQQQQPSLPVVTVPPTIIPPSSRTHDNSQLPPQITSSQLPSRYQQQPSLPVATVPQTAIPPSSRTQDNPQLSSQITSSHLSTRYQQQPSLLVATVPPTAISTSSRMQDNPQPSSQVTPSQLPSTRYQQQPPLPPAVIPSSRTHGEPTQRPIVQIRDSQTRKVETSASARLPGSGTRPPEKVSRTISEESSLKTPSSLAPSMLNLKQTPSHTSIPASVSSQQDSRKKGFFDIFRPKSSQPQPQQPQLQPQPQPQLQPKPQPQPKHPKFEIWHPNGQHTDNRKESRKAEAPPTMPRGNDTKVVSSQTGAPVAITVPITIAPSGRRSPNSNVFTPFRYLTSKRNRNMSAASVEAQDGTAPNTVVGSPTASVHSQPPIQVPPQRDPWLATQEWRKREAAEARAKVRRQRPGVVFDVAEDPLEDQHRSRPTRARPSSSQGRSS